MYVTVTRDFRINSSLGTTYNGDALWETGVFIIPGTLSPSSKYDLVSGLLVWSKSTNSVVYDTAQDNTCILLSGVTHASWIMKIRFGNQSFHLCCVWTRLLIQFK